MNQDNRKTHGRRLLPLTELALPFTSSTVAGWPSDAIRCLQVPRTPRQDRSPALLPAGQLG
jgi:hypothetical protein